MGAISLISEQEYLALERAATDVKSEYVNGEVYAMSGARRAHDRLHVNLLKLLGIALEDRPCHYFSSEMKVRSELAHSYYYPDASALCGEPAFLDATEDVLTNPSVIVEILSPSTERICRHEKFTAYRLIPSLIEYVLVSQHEHQVELFTKTTRDDWSVEAVTSLGQSFHLRSIQVEVRMDQLYKGVTLTKREP